MPTSVLRMLIRISPIRTRIDFANELSIKKTLKRLIDNIQIKEILEFHIKLVLICRSRRLKPVLQALPSSWVVAGGSSGGSAVAVASGAAFLSLGKPTVSSELWIRIRIQSFRIRIQNLVGEAFCTGKYIPSQ
jgi:hypothetical protein